MSSIVVSPAQTNPVASASQSRLVKQVLKSDLNGVQKALRAASVDDIANAIRANNNIVAAEVKGGIVFL
jgi:phosphopantothenate synthetase